MPKRRPTPEAAPLEMVPTLVYHLMTGLAPLARMEDFWELEMEMPYRDPEGWLQRERWPLYAAVLTAEGKRFGFVPWAATGVIPRGPGVHRWAAQHIAKYTLPPPG